MAGIGGEMTDQVKRQVKRLIDDVARGMPRESLMERRLAELEMSLAILSFNMRHPSCTDAMEKRMAKMADRILPAKNQTLSEYLEVLYGACRQKRGKRR